MQSPLAALAAVQSGPLDAASETLATGGLAALAGLVVVALLAGLALLFVTRYKRCPANRVLVISGKVAGGNAARVISGGGAFIWPVIQEYAYLSLEPMQIGIDLKDALSAENIRVAVPSVFTVAIGSDTETQQNAAMRILGRDPAEIVRDARDIIFGVLRAIIASMQIDEINRDRDALLHRIQHQLEPELKKIGLVLINVNIHDLQDESGYIKALGQKAASMAIQTARADVADQEKMGTVRVAQANRDKEIQVAVAEKERQIGLADAQREQAVQIAEIERLRQVGEQTAAFQRDVAVKNAEQEKRIAIASADAKAFAGEASAQAEIVSTQAQLDIRRAEAFQAAETRKREAEAKVQESQNLALAKAALAHAERVEAEQRAALEAPMRAEKARRIVEAEAMAEQVRLAAEAEAAAVRLKLLAQAEGEAAIIEKRAEALGQLVKEAGGAREAFMLMMQEQLPTLAETAAKAISGIKIDKVVVWEGGNAVGNGANAGATANFIQSMARSMPPIMHTLKDIAGVELPSFLGTMEQEKAAGAALPPDVKTPGSVVAEKKEGEKT